MTRLVFSNFRRQAIRGALAALTVLLVGCDSAPRAGNPSARAEKSVATEAPAQPVVEPREPQTSARDELLALIDSAESFARVHMGFAITEQIQHAEDVARGWARDELGITDATLAVVGVRSGHPAFSLSRADGSERRGLVVIDDTVLEGERGFRRFVTEFEPRRDALRWASAWILLVENVASEPLGPWSTPVDTPPRFDDQGLLETSWRRDDGSVHSVRLEIASDGSVRTRSRRPR